MSNESIYNGHKNGRFHISCGGIVYRQRPQTVEVLLLHRSPDPKHHWRDDSWHLPKGTRHDDEAVAEAAQREITEETGYEIELGPYLDCLHSFFPKGPDLIHKITHYYTATPVKKISDTTSEHDGCSWVSLEKAYQLLAPLPELENEREILEVFESHLSEILR